MIPAEIIKQKRDGAHLSKDHLCEFIQSYMEGSIADYQMTALLMAIFFNGMDDDELYSLVDIMVNSGEKMDFSNLECFVADKHSTGGVGDKVSIILAPILAEAGLAIPMISGRGLGHTGGTLDKLETIPGFRVDLSLTEFRKAVEQTGIAMIGQTNEICPADRKMYSLRDVTGTIESIPLICSSIMSKKIAEGIQGLVLDVKIGNGAFIKKMEDAKTLGNMLKRIGRHFGITTDIVYSSMNQPLGTTAGLWCEVKESINSLKGNGTDDTMKITYELGSRLLLQAEISKTRNEAISLQKSIIQSGKGYEKFLDLVKNQGGSQKDIEQYTKLHSPQHTREISANRSGFIQYMDTYTIGLATVALGCGRAKITDSVDPTAGMEFLKKTGEKVQKGEPLIRCFNSDKPKLQNTVNRLESVFQIGEKQIFHPLIY
ncbi:MAG TPA: thymidine phosphorylase [Candidatus Marinimicrobia bacterium]|nr:thymidine phosphorylase [Candidatus Neomarinimicrobiota bacterium]|tara:strand:+ start:562 stop:1851 length:1290 start_codon:yes stop_codon:yes gene_type:complete